MDRIRNPKIDVEEQFRQAEARSLRPLPNLSLSEWAEKYFHLSAESSAETGRFRPWRFQRGIMDAITDSDNERVTVMKSARVGYTKILDAGVGYFVHQDPAPILVVNPRVEDAEDFSKTEITPMLRDCPALAEIIGAAKKTDPNFTMRKKVFRNGSSLSLLGANSPNEFRRITARVVGFDEVDAYPHSTEEGDPIDLGERRTTSFWNRKIIQGSTPTLRGASRIEKAWQESDQRQFFVPCPHCGEEQALEFGSNKPHGLRWPKDEAGTAIPEEAYYVCVNGCVIEESYKTDMVESGRWIAQRPDNHGHAGFHINALYSLFWNARWAVIAKEFLERKDDPARLQTFVNTVLGEPWEQPPEQEVDERVLLSRREVYSAQVPDGVAVLVASVDTQDDRLEVSVEGFGYDEESWVIDHYVLHGEPSQPDVWNRLDEVRLSPWYRPDGTPMYLQAMCVDTGGHHTQPAYDYCVARLKHRVWPIKGQSPRDGQRRPVFPKKPTRKTKGSVPVYIVNVDAAKDVVFHRMGITDPGPGYCHFPAHLDLDYFDQLTAEKPVVERVNGRYVRKYKVQSGRRNEAFDLRVYAYAALCGLQQTGFKLNRRAAEIGASRPHERGEPEPVEPSASHTAWEAPERPPAQLPQSPTPPPRRKRRKRGTRFKFA